MFFFGQALNVATNILLVSWWNSIVCVHLLTQINGNNWGVFKNVLIFMLKLLNITMETKGEQILIWFLKCD